jgi:hypothetical protein
MPLSKDSNGEYKRTILSSVRTGVIVMRGLGEKQRLDSYMTSSKIVFYLAKQPFTYYQLRRITKIHGNVLRRRLNDLDSKGIIIKFKLHSDQ